MSFKFLACTVSEQCQEIKQALASISYFNTWERDVVAECCRVSSVVEYPPDEIILGPSCGTSHTVYFLLEGVCQMIQTLHVEMKTNRGREKTLCKLYRFSDLKSSDSKSTNECYSSGLFKQAEKKADLGRSEKAGKGCVPYQISDDRLEEGERQSGKSKARDSDVEESNIHTKVVDDALPELLAANRTRGGSTASAQAITENAKMQQESENAQASRDSEAEREFRFRPDHHLKVLAECKRRRKETTQVCKKGTLPEKAKNIKCFFVQTGFLFKGACFGLEKFQKENFITSTTKVKCLKIPERFLFKHNPRYIWNRIRLFQSLYLPKDEDILERLRTERMWITEKKNQSLQMVSSKSMPNYTLINEVPYSLRLSRVG